MSDREGDDLPVLARGHRTAGRQQRASASLYDLSKGSVEIPLTGHSCDYDLPPDSTSRLLHVFELGFPGSVQQNGDDGGLGNQLVQQLESLGNQVGAAEKADAGNMAARTVEA